MKKVMFVLFVIVVIFMGFAACKQQSPSYPASTATPVATAPVADTATYSFENSTAMGWIMSLGSGLTVENSAGQAYRGTKSLKMEGTFVTGDNGAAVTPPSITNLTGRRIEARMWVPSNFPGGGAEIYVQSGAGWAWQNGALTTLTPGTWTLLTFDPLNPNFTSGTPDITNVLRVGIKFVPSTEFTGTVYIDSLDLYIFGTPTATNTPSPTFTATKTWGGTPDTVTMTSTITMTSTVTPTLTSTPALEYTNSTADNTNIQYYGRWDHTNPLAPRTGWGTSYIITSFAGTSIKLNFSAWDVWFSYAIDGDISNPDNFTNFEVRDQYNAGNALPSPTPLIITGLADTMHTIKIVRRNDGMGGKITFNGFGLDPGKTLGDPGPKAAKKMEFIGDSITCGSVNEYAGSNPCPEQWGNCIQDGYMAFGPQLARLYNAEGRTISRGGVGIYRNCPGCDPPATIASIYNRVFWESTPTVSPVWDFTSWQADVVVIALGTNDFSAGTPDETAFKAAYSGFLTDVRTYYPNAYILCTEPVPSWVGTTAGVYISAVVTGKADSKILYVPLRNPAAAGFPLSAAEYANDNTHPLEAAHTKIAAALKTWMDANILADLQVNYGW